MKKNIPILIVLLLCAWTLQAQKTFINDDPKGYFPKIMINKVNTKLFHRMNGSVKLWLYWNEVPKAMPYEDGRQRYKMTVYNADAIANRTFEFVYTMYAGSFSGKPTSCKLTATFVYKDKRPTKKITEYFDLQKNP